MSITRPGAADGSVLPEWEWDALLSAPPSLLDEDPSTLTLTSQLDFLAEVQRQRSWLASIESRALVAIAGGRARTRRVTLPGAPSEESVGEPQAHPRIGEIVDERVDLVAVALHRSAITVRRQVQRARLLQHGLQRTLADLEAGAITPEHADAIARVGDGVDPRRLATFEGHVLPKARHLTPAETAALARRVRARVDAPGEEERRRSARRHIDVRVWGEDDGLACLMARLPLADAARVHAAIEDRSRLVEVPCDASLGERRVAALVGALCGPGGQGSTGAVRADINVTVGLDSLLGLADEPLLIQLASGPAEPATSQALRELLEDPDVPVTLRRLVTDPLTGALLDRGRTSYRVPDDLRAFLVTRDGTCRFPGCTRRARNCEIDHAVAWERGGTTDRDNLGPLCVRHHLLKTHSGWSFRAARPDGATEWLGPDGREYTSYQLDGLWRRSATTGALWGRSATTGALRRASDRGGTAHPPGGTDPPSF